MKELSIEEKAKRYDEAIERLRNAFYDNNSRMCEEYRNAALKIIEPIFPELKESEDERIRKELISLVKETKVTDRYYELNKMLAWLEKQGEQKSQRMVSAEAKEAMYDKPAWSEEDEKMIEAIEALCDDKIRFTEFHDVKEHAYTVKNWLKSLKDRVQQQPKQEWSERDEVMLSKCIDAASGYYSPEDKQSMKDWLYFLKERYTWKPSEEQIDALEKVTNYSAFPDAKYCV